MIYNNIERVLVITKFIFNYYNTGFSLEITPKVQKVSQKYEFIHKLTTKCYFQMPSLFFSSTENISLQLKTNCPKTRHIKNVKLSTRLKRVYVLIMITRVICRKRKKTIKGEFISASFIHSDKDIFHSYFLIRKKNKMFLRI